MNIFRILFVIGWVILLGCAWCADVNPPLATVGMICGVIVIWRAWHGLL